jgi:hypothetical protein
MRTWGDVFVSLQEGDRGVRLPVELKILKARGGKIDKLALLKNCQLIKSGSAPISPYQEGYLVEVRECEALRDAMINFLLLETKIASFVSDERSFLMIRKDDQMKLDLRAARDAAYEEYEVMRRLVASDNDRIRITPIKVTAV